jgi:zinc transporter ZupT
LFLWWCRLYDGKYGMDTILNQSDCPTFSACLKLTATTIFV